MLQQHVEEGAFARVCPCRNHDVFVGLDAPNEKFRPALGAVQLDQVIIAVLIWRACLVDLVKRSRSDVLVHRQLNAARFTNTDDAADMLLNGRRKHALDSIVATFRVRYVVAHVHRDATGKDRRISVDLLLCMRRNQLG